MVKSKIFWWLLHAIAWALFFLLPLVSADHRPLPPNIGFVPRQPSVALFLITDICLLVLFYVNYFLLFPYFFRAKKFVQYCLVLFVFTLIVYIAQDYIRFYWFMPGIEAHTFEYRFHFGPILSMFFLIAVLGSGIRIAEEWLRTDQHNKAIEKERLDAELASLKAQINPHFLFNALNTIYSLTVTESDKASDAVIKLSKMMRYVMQDSQYSYVPLKYEVDHLENYIQFQKLRATDKLSVHYENTINNAGDWELEIAPLILIPFIENTFKYGVSTHDDSGINIGLHIADGALTLRTSNKVFKTSDISDATSGIGMKNTKRRLELIYPDKHELKIDNENGFYSVVLKIELK